MFVAMARSKYFLTELDIHHGLESFEIIHFRLRISQGKKVNGLKRTIGLTCELVAKTLPTVKMKTTKGARPTTEDP